MQAKFEEAMKEVRTQFPSLDPDVDSYLEGIIKKQTNTFHVGIITENGDQFESVDEVYEAVGSFLEGVGSGDVRKCCNKIFDIIHP